MQIITLDDFKSPVPLNNPLCLHNIRVIDGDTIRSDAAITEGLGITGITVRLAGIETYELTGHHKWLGKSAKDALASIIGKNPIIAVPHTNSSDRYGRLLAWLWTWEPGLFISVQHAMVDHDQAWWWWPSGDRQAHKTPAKYHRMEAIYNGN